MENNEDKLMKIYFGGWYQRTTLHLTEVFNMMNSGSSYLNLNKEKLKRLSEGLDLVEVSREVGYLEFIRAKTKDGVVIRYYEDGLYVMEKEAKDVAGESEVLEKYYKERFEPAINYLFSLGAPTPKELANIKSKHQVAVGVVVKDPQNYVIDEEIYGKVYNSITSTEITVQKTPSYIFLITSKEYEGFMEGLVDMQIFFREFKDQLQEYLDIHRRVWEEISDIKERKTIKGGDVEKVRVQLDSYQKTINLISSRINQMGTYVHTRADIAKDMKLTEYLQGMFQYKFDVLTNTHSYIKEIWVMTNNYMNAAIQVITDIKAQTTNKSIQSLQLITTYGVVGGIIGYLSRDSLPNITGNGLIYFGLLVVSTLMINRVVSWLYKQSKFKVSFAERVEKF